MESEVFVMTEKMKKGWMVLTALLVAAVLLSTCASIFAARGVHALQVAQAEAEQTKEDGVTIMNQYLIRSTLPISDAYRTGNTNGLSEKDKETLSMASAVLEEIITDGMTPYEKEKAVYDWMTTKLHYDTGALQVVPNTTADNDNPYGTLKYHNAVCVGYATTFRLFMQMLDIPCMVIHNKEAFHSWNLVQLDGDWYHVDIYSDEGAASYSNFNMNDDLASASHDWDREFFPAATSLTYNYGYQNRVTVEDVYQVPQRIRQAMEDRQGSLCLAFPGMDAANAQVVESLLKNTEQAISFSPDFQSLMLQHSWLPMTGGEYVVGLTITGYDKEEQPQEELPVETTEKINSTIETVFGVNPDTMYEDDGSYGEVMG